MFRKTIIFRNIDGIWYIYDTEVQFYDFLKYDQYNLATRYELLNAITLTWNNIFYNRLYAIC